MRLFWVTRKAALEIVAREMGIPSVVAVPYATSELREGEIVEVDGSTGTIRRVAGW